MMRLPELSLESLIAVVAVAEHGGINSAARELGLTPSAVDKRIRAVAQTLGTKLFRTTESGLTLTDAGRVFVAPALKSLQYAALAEERSRAHVLAHRPSLLLGHSSCLAPRLLALLRRLAMPGLPKTSIEHQTGLTVNLAERVLDGKLHAAVGFLPVRCAELIEYEIYEEPLMACLPSDHALARRPMLSPTDLNGESVIAAAREPFPALHEGLEEYFDSFSVKLRVVADAFMPSEALTMTAQKVGICLLAKSSAVPQPGVAIKPLAATMLTRKTGLIVREDHRGGPVAALVSVILKETEPLRPPIRRRA